MKFFNNLTLIAILAVMFVVTGCDKTKLYDVTVPRPAAHFVGERNQFYSVTPTTPAEYKVVVGTTDVANVDRIVTYNITSPTGAVLGTDYTMNRSGTVTIPAGKTMDTITFTANPVSYPLNAVDTLVIALTQPSLEITAFSDTVILIISGPSACNEATPILTDLVGSYPNTNEVFGTGPYGPYTTGISAVTVTGPTSGTIVVTNIWDNGWGPITFNLNWSNPSNPTAIVVPQMAIPGSNAGDINATYAGQTIAVRVPSAALSATPGFYSYCNKTFTLKMQLGVTGVGYFNALYTVNMAQ